MGDRRFDQPYRRVAGAADRVATIQALTSEELVMALAGASRSGDPLVANVLATEALNRARRSNVVLENIAEGIVALDLERRVTFANPAALELLGYDRDELLGQDFHALVHYQATGQPMPLDQCVVASTLATGRTTYWRDHGDSFRRKDGSLFTVEITSAAIEREGEVVGAVVVVSDVTKQIDAEIAIGRLAAVVEHSVDAIITLANDGSITHANQAAETVLGYDASSLVGLHILTIVPDEAHPRAQELLARIRRGEPVRQEELPHRRRDGRVIATSLTAFPVYDRQGRLVAISGILRDVTEERRRQRERASAHAREREMHNLVKYRLATLLPALVWGLGSVIVIRTILLVWFALVPQDLNDLVVLATTTGALVVGAVVGLAVYLWRRARERQEAPEEP